MSIIRTGFYFTLVVFLLPSPPENANKTAQIAPQAASQQVFAAAAGTASDVSGFCDRQPDVCETASHLVKKLEAKAKYSVQLLYEWANEPQRTTAMPDRLQDQAFNQPLITGSIRQVADRGSESQNTLRIEDLIPQWRGPKPAASSQKQART